MEDSLKSIINPIYKNEILKRISNLENSDVALWGKMNVNEMICHCSDQIRMGTGITKTDFVGNKLLETVLKQLVLLGMPSPKGKVETVKELKQGVGGTKPTGFEMDRENLKNLVNGFEKTYPGEEIIIHPAFGKMNKKQWGRLIYVHTDHHLKQFGK